LGHLVVATEHHTIAYSAALNIIDFDNNTLVTSISLPQLPNAWDLNNNLLAVAYGDTDSDITIQVFDITTGRECYYHLLQENYGTYTLRLDHEKIYFVSDL